MSTIVEAGSSPWDTDRSYSGDSTCTIRTLVSPLAKYFSYGFNFDPRQAQGPTLRTTHHSQWSISYCISLFPSGRSPYRQQTLVSLTSQNLSYGFKFPHPPPGANSVPPCSSPSPYSAIGMHVRKNIGNQPMVLHN